MNIKYQGMFVDIQLGDGVILAEMIDEKENSVLVKCLEETDNQGHYSFRNPVWISKEHIISSYSAVRDMESLGYKEVCDNLFISNDSSDEDFVPSDEDDDDDDTSLCSDDSLN
jgi:hypothetical protein